MTQAIWTQFISSPTRVASNVGYGKPQSLKPPYTPS